MLDGKARGHMVSLGLVAAGHLNDPKPQWEVLPGGGHGEPIDKYARYIKEIPANDIDEAATPEAVAAILGRKPRKD
jgi:hypothetical protein